jgi:predicted nucleic acid-binding protein
VKIDDALRGVVSVLLDTAPVIYHLEKNPVFAPAMEEFLRLRAERGIVLVTTPITLAECLVHPIQQGRADLEFAYRALITTGENTTFWPIGEEEGAMAARLRAKYGLTLDDSLQMATAVQANCQVVLTNDAALAKVTEVRVLVVGDLQL